MHYYFNREITTETVNELVEKLEQFEGEINLYFSTNGGHSPSMTFLTNYFNSIKDRLTITLVDDVWSAGTQLLYDFEGKIILDLDEWDFTYVNSLSELCEEIAEKRIKQKEKV
jgi:hypothetical protein